MPPSPSLSARMTKTTYLSDTIIISAQKISDTMPSTSVGGRRRMADAVQRDLRRRRAGWCRCRRRRRRARSAREASVRGRTSVRDRTRVRGRICAGEIRRSHRVAGSARCHYQYPYSAPHPFSDPFLDPLVGPSFCSRTHSVTNGHGCFIAAIRDNQISRQPGFVPDLGFKTRPGVARPPARQKTARASWRR